MVDGFNRLLYSTDSMVRLFAHSSQTTGRYALLCLWGEGITWQEIRAIWLWAMVAYKLIIAMMVFVAIWLTIWAKRLTK